MRATCFSLGEMQANCYLLEEDDNCIIIDPADDAPFLLEEIQRRNLTLQAMVATHGHFDHIMAAGEIQLSYDVPFYIFEEDIFLIDRLEQTAEHFLGYKPTVVKPKKVEYLKEGMTAVSDFHFQVIKTPGHTPGSACFYLKNEGSCYTGDTLFKEGIGRYDFSYSNKRDLKKSLETILSLPGETIVYPGHGESTFVQEEHADELLTF